MDKLTPIQRLTVYQEVLDTFESGYGVCMQLRAASERLGFTIRKYTTIAGVIPQQKYLPRYFYGKADLETNLNTFIEFSKQKPKDVDWVGAWWPIDDDKSRKEALKRCIKELKTKHG